MPPRGFRLWENKTHPSTTHGHTKDGYSPTYITWKDIRPRCENPNHPRYADWGGRGIKICKRWYSFENFLADMGPRPEGKILDRKDNDKGYYKSNCHWVDPSASSRNRRIFKTNKSGYKGVSVVSDGYFRATGHHNRQNIYLGRYKTALEAHKVVQKWRQENIK